MAVIEMSIQQNDEFNKKLKNAIVCYFNSFESTNT